MKSFRKNVFRLARQNLGSMAGAICIIAIGIFVYAAMIDTLQNLQDQVSAYYQSAGLADVFAEVKGITETELEQFEEIPGIDKASGRMSTDIRLLAEGQTEIVTVHLMSYDPDALLNRIQVKGADAGQDSLYLGSRMAGEYGYPRGTSLGLLIDGKRVDCVLAGTCSAADYVYAIPPGGAMIPDGRIYDIACMDQKRMEELTGRDGALNELGFKLKGGYTYEDVRYELHDRLENYGLESLSAKKDQASFSMVDSEMGELISMGTVLPGIFMAISIFMLYVVLKKMIDREQSLIGTMKAFGLRDGELIGAYLFQGVAIGTLGAVLGCILAVPFGKFMFQMYVEFFNLPDTVYHSYMSTQAKGLAIALATGLVSTYLGVRGILSISPAQAMRAKSPSEVRSLPLPDFIARRMGTMEKMGCRSIARNPFRGFLIVLAIAFPFSMGAVLFSFDGVAKQMYYDQFETIQTYDLQLSLERPIPAVRAANAGAELAGVTASEGIFTTAAELTHENRSEFAMLYGLNPGSDLWRIRDIYGTFFDPPEDGIILNTRTAEKLHLKEGDLVSVNCTGLTAEPVKLPVRAVIAESLGGGCYIGASVFSRYFNTGPIANTILVKSEPNRQELVKSRLLDTSQITWLVDTGRILTSYKQMMASMMSMIHMFALMSAAAGGILIYNSSVINIRERITEFGTLIIMGSSGREIRKILLFEQLVYFVLGILLGIPGIWGLKRLLETMVMSESYTIDIEVKPESYAMAFLICLCIVVVSWLSQTRIVRNICLTDILKERE